MPPRSLDALRLGDVLPALEGFLFLFLIDEQFRIVDHRLGDGIAPFVPPDAFLGQPIRESLPPAAAKHIEDAIRATVVDGVARRVAYNLPQNGTEEQFEAQIVSIGDGYSLALVTHLSRAAHTEQQLRRRELELDTILEAETGCVKLFAPDGSLMRINRAGLAMLQVDTMEEANARGNQTWPNPAHLAMCGEFYAKAFAGEGGTMEYELIGAKGKRTWLESTAVPVTDVDGKVQAVLVVAHDISERHATHVALQASEERLRALLEVGLDIVFTMDGEGRLTFAGPSVTSVLGFAPEDIVGRYFPELAHPDDAAAHFPRFRELLSGTRSHMRGNLRLRHKDGTWRILDGSLRDMRSNPAVATIVLNLRDITGQRELQEQLWQADKLESIGRLAGGIAHDFNNILTAILGTTDLLLHNAESGRPVATDDLREIQFAADRARALTRQLLTFARRQVIAPRIVDANDVLRGMEKMLRRLVGADIEIRTVLQASDWKILIDPSQLEQVILNLVLNARDAMPSGGTLTIETRNVELTRGDAATHRGVMPGPHVLLAVSDTGVGISKDALPHLFEPFYTTKRLGDGSGLGLSTVYGIVRQSMGVVWVYSEPGLGTTFKLHWPVAGETSDPRRPKEATHDSPPRGTETILLVEDDDAVRSFAQRALEESGYRVLVASGPDEAVGVSQTHRDETIDLLLTDVVMPGRPGPALATELVAARPAMQVIFMSGYTEDTIVHRGVLGAGMNFLPKPFTLEQMQSAIRRALDARSTRVASRG